MLIDIKSLDKIILKVLRRSYSQTYARRIADVILYGELSGRTTHGLVRLTPGSHGAFVDQAVTKPLYDHKTKLSTLIDGGGNPGMLVASLATDQVIKIGKENGFGIVGTTNSQNSIGALSYYCKQITDNNLIGIIYARPPATMAPFGATKSLFGTNPQAYGFPADPLPLIFDMSTSAITFGEITKRRLSKTNLPGNVTIDIDGKPTQDPNLVASILPFDPTHKGSGIAMIVEILAAVWTGSSFLNQHIDRGLGNIFIALSPNLLSDTKTFKSSLAEFIESLKLTPTQSGNPIRIPGQKTLLTYETNLKKGNLEISDQIYKILTNSQS